MKNRLSLIIEKKLCSRGKKTADDKYDKWSAYAAGYAKQVCAGEKPDSSGKTKTEPAFKNDKNDGKSKMKVYDSVDFTNNTVTSEHDKIVEMYQEYRKLLKKLIKENKICKSGLLNEKKSEKDKKCTKSSSVGYKGGEKVDLYKPFRESKNGKKFAVYTCTDSGNVSTLRFGAQGYTVKNGDEKARKSFISRFKCDEKKDKNKASYWICNMHKYAKSLGLSSSKQW